MICFRIERKKTMTGEDRRKEIIGILQESKAPVSGLALAKQFAVSRQVIVQDIALLRANGSDIVSTNRGYLLQRGMTQDAERIFKVIHSDEDTRKELTMIVDMGGKVVDVFVYHKVYGVLRADMNIKSRRDIDCYMEEIKSGKSSLLKNVTSGYHYHTVHAESEEILDEIQKKLQEIGFLARLSDYEPVDFWKNTACL
jgi:hypothetical protein